MAGSTAQGRIVVPGVVIAVAQIAVAAGAVAMGAAITQIARAVGVGTVAMGTAIALVRIAKITKHMVRGGAGCMTTRVGDGYVAAAAQMVMILAVTQPPAARTLLMRTGVALNVSAEIGYMIMGIASIPLAGINVAFFVTGRDIVADAVRTASGKTVPFLTGVMLTGQLGVVAITV